MGFDDITIRKWRVSAAVPRSDHHSEVVEIEGTEKEAHDTLGDLLEGLGVETAIEEVENDEVSKAAILRYGNARATNNEMDNEHEVKRTHEALAMAIVAAESEAERRGYLRGKREQEQRAVGDGEFSSR